jgi:predicted RNase H-like nuclease (RuvC/YqgF family)
VKGLDSLRLFEAYEECRADNTAHFRKIMELQKALEAKDKRIEELQSKLDICIKALEFYSLKSNYSLVDEGRNYSVEYKCYELNEQTYGDEELGTKAKQTLSLVRSDKSQGGAE